MQFPWRFLLLVAPATSLLCAVPVAVARERRYVVAVGGALIAALLFTGMPHARPAAFTPLEDAALTPEAIRATRLEVTSLGELRPRWARSDPAAPATTIAAVASGSGRLGSAVAGNTRHAVDVEAATEAVVRLNVHYFPGWVVAVDGRPAVVRVTDPEGLMEVTVSAGRHRLEAAFTRTPIQLAAEALSLTALIALIAVAVLNAPFVSGARGARDSPDPLASLRTVRW